jgi:hypothetical protein
MTDRIAGFLVVLDADIRPEVSDQVIAAIRLLPHVVKVTPFTGGYEQHIADERARQEIGAKLLAVLYPDRKGRW